MLTRNLKSKLEELQRPIFGERQSDLPFTLSQAIEREVCHRENCADWQQDLAEYLDDRRGGPPPLWERRLLEAGRNSLRREIKLQEYRIGLLQHALKLKAEGRVDEARELLDLYVSYEGIRVDPDLVAPVRPTWPTAKRKAAQHGQRDEPRHPRHTGGTPTARVPSRAAHSGGTLAAAIVHHIARAKASLQEAES